MITLNDLLPVLAKFLVGDENSGTIISSGSTPIDSLLDCRVAHIDAMLDTPVVWIFSASEDDTSHIDWEPDSDN